MNVDELLAAMGYSREWLELGVISEVGLRQQYADFCASDDPNTEHWRAAAWRRWLATDPSIDDETLPKLLELRDEGADGYDLAEDRLIMLIDYPGLSDPQFQRIAELRSLDSKALQKRHRRQSIRRRLAREGLSSTAREELRACEDAVAHGWWLEHEELGAEDVHWLSEFGANKAVRNRAKDLSRSGRFRGEG